MRDLAENPHGRGDLRESVREMAENPHGRGDLRESVREMAENPQGGGEAGVVRFGSSAKMASESGKRSSCGIIMWYEERKEP